jgi:hypothetical protein
MRTVVIAGSLLALCISLAAQVADPRSYNQIAATEKKTVVDYFLLCPYIAPYAIARGGPFVIGLVEPSDRMAVKGSDLDFRKRLLTVGGDAPRGAVVKSVIVDVKNAYIRIDGAQLDAKPFSLVFVYFDRADKSRIPAVAYRYSMDDSVEDRHIFFDLSDNSWRPLPDGSILPRISDASLAPYAGSGDSSTTSWMLELPRYGTTIRFLPVRSSQKGRGTPEFARADIHLDALKPYALECAWDKARARFMEALPALADKADIPKGAPVAADYFGLLRRQEALDKMLDDSGRRAARDAWKTAPDGQAKHGPNYFEWVGQDMKVQVAVLGSREGLPLVAVVAHPYSLYTYGTFLYHADSGLLEEASLMAFSAEDFYMASRQARARAAYGNESLICEAVISPDTLAIGLRLSDENDPPIGNLPPDYSLDFRWDGEASTFVKTSRPF